MDSVSHTKNSIGKHKQKTYVVTNFNVISLCKAGIEVPTWELLKRNIHLTDQAELSLHLVHRAVTLKVQTPIVVEPVVIRFADDFFSNADLWCKTEIQIKVKDGNEEDYHELGFPSDLVCHTRGVDCGRDPIGIAKQAGLLISFQMVLTHLEDRW